MQLALSMNQRWCWNYQVLYLEGRTTIMMKDRMELADTPPLRVVNIEQSQLDTGQACMLQSSHHNSA